jgi:aminoglycoside phosphotransferase (APT) family kinase protein
MIEAIKQFLAERWTTLRPGRPPLAGALVAGVDRSPAAKVTVILFDTEGAPAAVAKVARAERAEPALRAEHAALRALRPPGEVAGALGRLPEPLALERVRGRLVFVQSPMAGVPMSAGYHTPGHTADPARVEADFVAAGAWLSAFQQATRVGGGGHGAGLDAEGVAVRVAEVVRRYRAEIGWSPAEASLFEWVADQAAALARATPLPVTGVHGDFWMGNLLVDGGEVRGVIDWERGRAEGLPFADVYKFPTSYGFYLDRAYPGGHGRVPGHPERHDHQQRWRRYGDWANLPGFGYTWFGRGWFPELVRRHVGQALDRLGVPPAANAVFFPLFLADQATALDDPAFRAGYRSLLLAFLTERSSTWLWQPSAA